MGKYRIMTAVILLLLGMVAACDNTETATATPVAMEATMTAVLPSPQPTLTPTPPTVLIDGSETVTRTTVVIQPQATAVPPTEQPCLFTYSLVESQTFPGAVLGPNTPFLQIWRIRNDGTCPWQPGSSWVFTSDNQMGGPDRVALPAAVPGEIVEVSLTLVAPAAAGLYTGLWQPQMADGLLLQPPSTVTIQVIPMTPAATAVPPTPTATPFITGWRGEYFNNRDLQGSPVLVRDDPEINFNWGTGVPGEGLQNGNFSARWTRTIVAPGGIYRFYARSEDGVRVWVNNVLIFDEWADGQNATFVSDVNLRTGDQLDVRVEYYHATGLANVHVWAELQSDFPEWRGSYIADPNLQGQPVLIRNDQAIDFNWGTGSPAAGVPSNNFSVTWIRTLNFAAGTYRFYTEVDDGMRLYVDSNLVIDEWHDGTVRQASGLISLTAGPHDITVEYYERRDAAQIKVWWEAVPGIQ